MLLAAASLASAAEPAPIPDDEIDLVFLESNRPCHIRLHVQFNGRSYQDHWRGVIEQLFRHVDSDGNGTISLKELETAPSAEQFRAIVLGNAEIEGSPPPTPADLADRSADNFTLAQIRAYYHRTGVGPWQMQSAFRGNVPRTIDNEWIKQIGCSDPESPTKEELQRAATAVLKLDLDRDEMITIGELAPTQGVPGFGIQQSAPKRESAFVHFELSAKGRQVLAARLIARYDRNKNEKIESDEIAFSPAVKAAIDADRNGTLEAAELEKWPDQRPDAELIVRMDVPHPSDPVRVHRRNDPAKGSRLAATRIGSVRIEFASDEVEVLRVEGGASQPRGPESLLINDFQTHDQNQDGILDRQEIHQPPFRFVPYSRLADRNCDEKLSRKEIGDYVNLQKRLYTRMTTVTLVNRGRVLYELLDQDNDARLSQRELRRAWDRVLPWADAKAGTFSRDRLPRQYQIILSHGALSPSESDPGRGRIIRSVERLRGPTWFRQTDRNADGDVSRSEFLGTAEQFRKLDRDADGLIDAEEAAAASTRKK